MFDKLAVQAYYYEFLQRTTNILHTEFRFMFFSLQLYVICMQANKQPALCSVRNGIENIFVKSQKFVQKSENHTERGQLFAPC